MGIQILKDILKVDQDEVYIMVLTLFTALIAHIMIAY